VRDLLRSWQTHLFRPNRTPGCNWQNRTPKKLNTYKKARANRPGLPPSRQFRFNPVRHPDEVRCGDDGDDGSRLRDVLHRRIARPLEPAHHPRG